MLEYDKKDDKKDLDLKIQTRLNLSKKKVRDLLNKMKDEEVCYPIHK